MKKKIMTEIYNEVFNNITNSIKDCFANILGLNSAIKYIQGLLSPIERKNGWQLAESQGDKTPYTIQQFIYRGRWGANEARDKLQEYIKDTTLQVFKKLEKKFKIAIKK